MWVSVRVELKMVCVEWVYVGDFVTLRYTIVKVVRKEESLQHSIPKSTEEQLDLTLVGRRALVYPTQR